MTTPDGQPATGGALNRRDVLRLTTLVGLGAALAGCTGSSGDAVASSSGRTSSGSSSASASTSAHTSTSASRPAAPPSLAALEARLRGPLYRPGRHGYDPAALLYNPRFTSARPQAIARCADAADVAACVQFAADSGTPLHVRNGGHSYGGWSSGSGLVVDLADINAVQVHGRTATVGAGALLADVYTKLSAKGVSIGAGSCPTVGVTGLTLGGGVGVLARAYGLTCDQVRAMQVVTADGKTHTVDAHTEPDLFWALRGGGGSFGAVTSLTFDARPAPRMQRFYLQWSWSAAADVLLAWQQWIGQVPRELWSTCKLLADPGRAKTVSVSGTWVGSGSLDKQLDALLRHTPAPSTRSVNSDSYVATMLTEAGCSGQSASGCISTALTPAKRQPFAATSAIVSKPLPSAGVTAIVGAVAAGMDVSGMVEGGVSFDALGGAVGDVHADSTAFPWRSALCDVQYTATWPGGGQYDPSRYDAFVHHLRATLHPWLGDAAYLNYADPSITNYASAYWGPNLPRLQQVKKARDPHNVFTFAQSVPH